MALPRANAYAGRMSSSSPHDIQSVLAGAATYDALGKHDQAAVRGELG